MKAYSGEITYTASASTAASGYPATNLAIHSIGRPWRSTVTTATTVTLDMGSSKTPAGMMLQDCNFASCTVHTSPDNSTWTLLGTMTLAADGNGRYKGLTALAVAHRYTRVSIASGTPTDGAAYFRIGAAYMWLSVATFRNPNYGLKISYLKPQVRNNLPNGMAASVSVGNNYAVLSGEVSGAPGDDVAALVRLARAGVVGLDLELPSQLWINFPIEEKEERQEQTTQNYGNWPVGITLREVV